MTARWLSRAPAPDADWEYYPSRQRGDPRDAKLVMEMDGVRLDYEDFAVSFVRDERRCVFDVVVSHPRFAEMGEDTRLYATFVMLDDLLGEDDVDRWLGRIERSTTPQSSTRSALAGAVDALRAEPATEQFVGLEGRARDGRPMVAIANLAIKKLDHILMDTHFEIAIAYEASADGMCSGGLLDEMNTMEDDLLESLGPDAVFVGHETGLGKRVILVHATSDGPVPAAIERWERRYMNREIETIARADPQWEILRRW